MPAIFAILPPTKPLPLPLVCLGNNILLENFGPGNFSPELFLIREQRQRTELRRHNGLNLVCGRDFWEVLGGRSKNSLYYRYQVCLHPKGPQRRRRSGSEAEAKSSLRFGFRRKSGTFTATVLVLNLMLFDLRLEFYKPILFSNQIA